MRRRRVPSLQKALSSFARQDFLFLHEFFCNAKKWDCSLRFGLPSLRSGSSALCAAVESRLCKYPV
jgi:hypothetical protein